MAGGLTQADLLRVMRHNVTSIAGPYPHLLSCSVAGELFQTNRVCVGDDVTTRLYFPEREDLFLVVHNIDGTMLRGEKAQLALSLLARVRGVHLIASLDHINAPLRECCHRSPNWVVHSGPVAGYTVRCVSTVRCAMRYAIGAGCTFVCALAGCTMSCVPTV